MRSKHLAFRLTFTSFAMILAIYLFMQTISFFRDNIMLGIGDLSALVPSVLGFILSSVLPPMVVFAAVIYLVALPIQKVEMRLDSGEILDDETKENTRMRMLGFSRLILGVNLTGFALGYVLSQVVSGKSALLFSPNGLLILASNLAGGFIFAQAQTSFNNLAFAPLREKLGIHEIGHRRRELRSSFKQVFLTGLLGFYVISVIQFNMHDISYAAELEDRVLRQVQSGKMQPDQAAQAWRDLVKSELYIYSGRSGMDVQTLPLPWDRPDSVTDRQQACFYLMFLFVGTMLVFLQVVWSLDRKEQLAALSQRLKDVVAGGGDLKKRINLRSMDDIGELTDLINQVLARFQDVVVRIGQASRQTQESSQSIVRVLADSRLAVHQTAETFRLLQSDLARQTAESRRLLDVLESFKSAAQGVDQAVEQQREHVTEASSTMEEMASSIESVENMTAQAGDLTVRLAGQGTGGQSTVGETTLAMAEIESTTSGVISVLDVLGKISASTNLLAMNAAIEAAHAGDHGQGFAVVAEEVRSLANNSAHQTRQIREHLKTMSHRVRKGVEATGSSAQLLRNLVAGLQESADISVQISRAMKEQSIGTRAAADTLVRIVQSSDHITQAMDEQNQEAQAMQTALESAIHRLESLVKETEAQSGTVRALDAAFQAVDQEVEKNMKAVQGLGKEIERFTTV